jgi:hypothetical protein
LAFPKDEQQATRLSRTTVVSQEEQNGNKKEKGNEEENHKTPGEKEMNTKLHTLSHSLDPKNPT